MSQCKDNKENSFFRLKTELTIKNCSEGKTVCHSNKVCDKGFARHATLWNHRRIHTGEKPYKCETCGSAFSQAAHLKNHTKVHSGEKPFKCDICTAAFADRFALKRHRGIHDKYGQTAPLTPRVPQNQQEQQNNQQQPSEQQNTQATVEVEHRTEQTL